MSFIDCVSKCNYDGKTIEDFPVFLSCGYTICSDHLISESKRKDLCYLESLFDSSDSIQCYFCDNHQLVLKECFSIPRNMNFLKEKIFSIKKEQFIEKINDYIEIEKDPKTYISQKFNEIIKQFDLRRETIKQEIDNYYVSLIEEVKSYQFKEEENLKKKLKNADLKKQEAILNNFAEEIKLETNVKSKSNLLEEKLQSIQDIIIKFSNFDEHLKENVLKLNDLDLKIRKSFRDLVFSKEINEENDNSISFREHEISSSSFSEESICYSSQTSLNQKIDDHSNSLETDLSKDKKIKNSISEGYFYDKNFNCIKTIQVKSAKMSTIMSLPSGEIIIPASDHKINVFDGKGNKCLRTLIGHKSGIFPIILLKNGELATGANDNTIKIWDIDNEKCLKTIKTSIGVRSLKEFSSYEIIGGMHDGTITFWNIKTKKCLMTLEGHTGSVWALEILKQNELASCSYDKTIRIWDIETGEGLRILEGHDLSVNCIRVLKSILISGSNDCKIKIWNLNSGQCIKTLKTKSSVYCLEVFENGEFITGSNDGTVQFWDINNFECKKTIKAHSKPVSCICLLPTDGFVTNSFDNSIKIWNHNDK